MPKPSQSSFSHLVDDSRDFKFHSKTPSKIMANMVLPQVYLNTLIYATSNLFAWVFVVGRHLNPYNIVVNFPQNFPFTFRGDYLILWSLFTSTLIRIIASFRSIAFMLKLHPSLCFPASLYCSNLLFCVPECLGRREMKRVKTWEKKKRGKRLFFVCS